MTWKKFKIPKKEKQKVIKEVVETMLANCINPQSIVDEYKRLTSFPKQTKMRNLRPARRR